MPTDHRTASLTAAMIAIGGFHFPIAVALGALTGASVFMISAKGYTSVQKIALFFVSLVAGFFIAEDVNPIVNAMLPMSVTLELGGFATAAIAAAAAVTTLQLMNKLIAGMTTFKGIFK